MPWQPSADLRALRARAALLRNIRAFFDERGVLEVETPLLCSNGITDPSIEPLKVECGTSIGSAPRYLQTSPEYAMKRLLAAGSGPIYQVARAFRDGEAGSRHNPEFTLLEWYRPGLDYRQLMAEVEALLRCCLGDGLSDGSAKYYSYRQLFIEVLAVDPFLASAAELEACARQHVDAGGLEGDCDLWLDLLMSHVIEPVLATRGLCFVYDYPCSQAALSRIAWVDGVEVGQRFEFYLDGLELGNGYFELSDAREQRLRFEADNTRRLATGLSPVPIDEKLLGALDHGLPLCSGVALGLDRLLMAASRGAKIRDVLAFDWARS